MASVFDVSAYILKKQGSMTAMKLQKLVYYCQAWSLVWDERPIFNEKIRAWANGPVVVELFKEHQGQYTVSDEPRGDWHSLTSDERDTVKAVLKAYGDRDADWLSRLTHKEQPWRDARVGIPEGERGNAEITHAAMAEYYGH